MKLDPSPSQDTPQSIGVVTVAQGKFVNDDLGVMLLLSAGSMTTDANGEPCPGLCLRSWQARRIAYMLLYIAEEQDARERLGMTT
jgi:hypothetical protein